MNKLERSPLKIPPIKAILAFEQAARFGNVAKAAEQLNITPSAVSHQLAKLEAIVGRPLFYRTSKGLDLTPVGVQYLNDISGALQRLGAATERASSDAGLECLRLHSVPSFGLLWLLPRLEQLRASNPDLEINLSCSYESLHFSRDKMDVDIRYGLANWQNLEIRTIPQESICVLASPSFLAGNNIDDPEDLLSSSLILSEAPLVKWPQWFAQHGLSMPEQRYSLSFDRSYMSLEAAAHGLGLALESTLLASDYIRSGRLIPVFSKDYSSQVSAHHLVFPYPHADYPRVRRFLDWMQKELGSQFNY